MKKYISPIAKSIELYGESALLNGSKDPDSANAVKGDPGEYSNRRTSIWGDEN